MWLSQHLQRRLPRASGHACEACGLTHTTLSPSGAAVALRSLPRRFLERIDAAVQANGAGEVLAATRDPSGRSALDRLADARSTLQRILGQLDRILILDHPYLADPLTEAARGPDDAGGEADPDALLASLAAVADRLARRGDEVSAPDWQRTGTWRGTEMSALDLLRLAVHEGVSHLRAFDRAIAATRHAATSWSSDRDDAGTRDGRPA